MRPRAILFDWTGTIAEPAPGRFVERFAEAMTAFTGSQVSPADAAAALRRHLVNIPRGGFDAAFAAVLRELSLDHLDVREAAPVFVAAEFRGQQVFPDARAALASLRYRGFKTAVVSNLFIPGRLMLPALGELGLANYFDVVVTSADTGRPKPHPAVFHEALSALRFDGSEALVVGDSPGYDIAGAQAAGLSAVLVDRDGRHEGFREAPVVDSLTGLGPILGEGVWPAS